MGLPARLGIQVASRRMRAVGCVRLLVVVQLACIVSALDLVIPSPSVLELNTSCADFTLPSMVACLTCTHRTITFTLEPHSGIAVQTVTVTDFPGNVQDRVVVVDNTGLTSTRVTHTATAYRLCSDTSPSVGWSVSTRVLLTQLPAPLPEGAISVVRTWAAPDTISAYVEFTGVLVSSEGCFPVTTNSAADGMVLCSSMATCMRVVQTATATFGCTSPSPHAWTIGIPGGRVFAKGQSVTLFADEPFHHHPSEVSAFPVSERTLRTIFGTVVVLLATVLIFVGVYSEVVDLVLTQARTCTLFTEAGFLDVNGLDEFARTEDDEHTGASSPANSASGHLGEGPPGAPTSSPLARSLSVDAFTAHARPRVPSGRD